MSKKATSDDWLVLYRELTEAGVRQAQRRLDRGELKRIAPGVLTSLDQDAWPALISRERLRVLAGLFPGAVIGPANAFVGGVPIDGVMYLDYRYNRTVNLPGLEVRLSRSFGATFGDNPMMGKDIYFPSEARILLGNLTVSRRKPSRSAGKTDVEHRLIAICEARGEQALGRLRDQARHVAVNLRLDHEFRVLNDLIGGVLGTKQTEMSTKMGKGLSALVPYDAARLALFEDLAATLRSEPLQDQQSPVKGQIGLINFAFIESYFSNFIEGTEFDIAQARAFVLDGKPITQRPKDSHDVLGVFRQIIDQGWANQTLSSGEPVLHQLQARHADQMQQRPEVKPGEFKTDSNRAGNTIFVQPRLVRGTLIQASTLLPSIPPGIARALYAMFVVSEVHPFNDGNGRLARLVMNAELDTVNSCRIIIPTLYREEYLDCLRVLTRDGNAKPFLDAMQWIQSWTASFDYENLDSLVVSLEKTNAFERSRVQYKLLMPTSKPNA